MRFDFRVKFYPEDIDEILQVKTLKLFFQQVNEIRKSNGGDYSIEKICILIQSYRLINQFKSNHAHVIMIKSANIKLCYITDLKGSEFLKKQPQQYYVL